jgi:sulfate adenylyltransferase
VVASLHEPGPDDLGNDGLGRRAGGRTGSLVGHVGGPYPAAGTISGVPTQWTPAARELDDLELILVGALDEPLALTLPDEVAKAAVDDGSLELTDPEGLPLATFTVQESDEPVVRGTVAALAHPEFGAFRRYHRPPQEVRDKHAGTPTFAVPVTGPLSVDAIEAVEAVARTEGAVPLLLAMVGTGTPRGISAPALVRATLAAAERIDGAEVVAVAAARRDDEREDLAFREQVALAYSDEAFHAPADQDRLPDAVQRIVDADRPPRSRRGLVVFFTGFSGSGKSTLARALHDVLLERGDRTVTSLDGDVVRRHLSAGLGFSREDRETNIRRIGWVAAEISRHRGLAVCSPIAPFAETRAQVRQMVEDAGGAFFLVHVATPLEECERRDRKGLYAKARAGEIPEFTGISSPYEEPDDAAVAVDTTGRTIEEALDDVIDALRETGHLELSDNTAVAADPVAVQPFRVLFVCTANICRSPYMERFARSLDVPGVEFTSAGTHGFDEHPMDPPMSDRLAGQGIDASDFRSRHVTPRLIAEADLVLTAEAAHRSAILEESPEAVRKVFTLGQAARLAAEQPAPLTPHDLVAALAERRTAPEVADDVADPYRRGDEAIATAAEGIASLLRRVFRQ